MRDEVCEAEEQLRSRGGRRQTAIVADVEHQIPAGAVSDGPEVSGGMAAQERLREMPDLSRHGETLSHAV